MSIIFRQQHEIVAGLKTQTRRVVKAGEFYEDVDPIMDYPAGVYAWTKKNPVASRVKWLVGRTYAAIPKMYQASFGRVLITDIRQERLHDITEADAQAEGVIDVEEYKRLWKSINGKTKGARWEDNPRVWVLTFKYVGNTSQ